ncbi:immunity 26/phosphotriesterase HocA family protein [Listeria cossartiae subsp. cayugensis]|uniref:Immunity 26/phosphotriesterase HocA family protein n=1 Tax=Listeria cossartiae subsp. cayugensis TaxID=2713505 RepID=A0ABU2ILP9_9LIST|nr:immunity 26/phosphotriesterase HocA family protein [Listeria cossartiae]MDT0002737.1 immunity 26/phosphotriesterase HocA family protein [Listeria cossartiae subsp. cayugensis]MDT0013453.1 immunity 26/phosphotriesterase HocA family protein [Listeria cossartiae subsp. cayugensis]MDT0018895.1 immunity 26/phosphotriesterase HocA family protein [Listeria cossartiae subsp. cayugensis]MDT0035532.1 immunity 26/phosphotriesterase HocA family protein [Listeria cossartiae subsp. cayugensis]MDT0040645.
MINNEIREVVGLHQILENDQKLTVDNAIVIIRENVLIKLILDQADFYKEIDFDIELTDNNELIGRKNTKPKALTLKAILKAKTKELRLKINKVSYRIELKLGVRHFKNLYFEQDMVFTKENVQEKITAVFGSDWLSTLAKAKLAVKTRQTIKQGSVFSYPIGNEYGFALVIGCFQTFRKQKIMPQDSSHYLNLMMGVPLVIRTFNYTSKQNTVDVQLLKQQELLNPEFIMDDLVLRGDFPIIGESVLAESDILFPMSFSFNGVSTTYAGYQVTDASDREIIKNHIKEITVRFDWGFGSKKMPAKQYLKRSTGKELFLPYSGLGMTPVAGYSKKLVSPKSIFSEEELKQIYAVLDINGEMLFDDFNEKYNGITAQHIMSI